VIKMIWFLRRKEGVSVEAFQTRWRESHSQIVLAAPHIRRYVQSYSIPEAYDFYDPPWDGMAEIWFDNIEEMTESEDSAAWKESGVDARDFIGGGARLVTTEAALNDAYPLASTRTDMIKYVGLSKRKQGLSVAEFQSHWRDKHGPLVMAAFPQMPRYVQSHPLPETYDSDRPPAYDGVPFLYFPSLDGFPWGLIKRVGPPLAQPARNPAGEDAQSLFELPIPGLVTREVAFID
jgi:uncharacterized protein (TIGR02118 family)